MSDSTKLKPERDVQPMFSKFKFFSSLTLAIPIIALELWLIGQPSRWPGPDRTVLGHATPVRLKGLQGWRLSAPDPRFGGISALAIDRGAMIALSDSGVVMRFAPPRQGGAIRFALHDLPAGPGSPLCKALRDSESLVADQRGDGWWVGFETRHSLFHFDRGFARTIGSQRIKAHWPPNYGAEALVVDAGGGVMALPELGGPAWGGTRVAPPWTSDATRLPDGRVALLVRRPTWRGFDNQVWIDPGAGKPARRIALGLAPLDNMEGIAAAPLPNGGTRLWIVSDDNFRPWMRTLLVALDLSPRD